MRPPTRRSEGATRQATVRARQALSRPANAVSRAATASQCGGRHRPVMNNASQLRIAGALLAGGALGFVLVFVTLAARLGYPEMLDHPASEVLPALLAGGPSLRAVWAIYAVLPFSIVLSARLASGRLGLEARIDRATRIAGTLAGLAMTIGLARWPTLQWALADRWTAEASAHVDLARTFDLANLVLGNGIGEFVGEVALGLWFAGLAYAMRARWVGRATAVLAALMLIGSLRNVTSLVQPATDLTNNLLPVVMIWLGVVWMMPARRELPSRALTEPAR